MKRNEGLKFHRQACQILRGLHLGFYYFTIKTAPSHKLPRGHEIMEPLPNVLRVDIDMTLGTTLHHQALLLTAFLFYLFVLFVLRDSLHKLRRKTKIPPCLAMHDKSTHPVMTRSRQIHIGNDFLGPGRTTSSLNIQRNKHIRHAIQTNKQTNKTKQQQKLHVMQRFSLVSKLRFALGLFTTERTDANHSYEKWP